MTDWVSVSTDYVFSHGPAVLTAILAAVTIVRANRQTKEIKAETRAAIDQRLGARLDSVERDVAELKNWVDKNSIDRREWTPVVDGLRHAQDQIDSHAELVGDIRLSIGELRSSIKSAADMNVVAQAAMTQQLAEVRAVLRDMQVSRNRPQTKPG